MADEHIRELEEALEAARQREAAAAERIRARHVGGEWEELRAAAGARLEVERSLARARGEEVAVPIEWTPRWSGGAPMPHVVASDRRTYLLYLVDTPDPGWDGSAVRVVDTSALRRETLAVATFERCYAHMFGGPNDEVFHGHRLAGRGLHGYGAYVVESSRWIAAEKQINSVHARFDPASWDDLQHYVLAFHDEMFECLARGWSVEVLETTFDEALQRLARLAVAR